MGIVNLLKNLPPSPCGNCKKCDSCNVMCDKFTTWFKWSWRTSTAVFRKIKGERNDIR